jgi:tellurite resistance protein TerC
MTNVTPYHWIGFHVFILTLLGMDLWCFRSHPHAIRVKEALISSCGWILLAILFNLWIYYLWGAEPALSFLTGYLVEKSLSVDNLFIFLLIFSQFQVPDTAKYQALFYGVAGAIVMRALLILTGIQLIRQFHWMLPLFGLLLVVAGIRLAFKTPSTLSIAHHPVYRWLKNHFSFTSTYHDQKFFIRENSRWLATPLFAVVILIEITDFIFALDSVPAILGITTDPFIAYTSNIFAILGLRSLFFALEHLIKLFHLLHYALSFILVFIGFKMIVSDFWHIPIEITLIVLSATLVIGMLLSTMIPSTDSRNH